MKRDEHMNVQVLHFINKSLKPLKKEKIQNGTFTEFYQGTVSIIIYFLSMTIYNSKTAIPDEVYLFIFYFLLRSWSIRQHQAQKTHPTI